ncbi:YesL family protein [Treponema sp. R8-4-B8]
MIGFLIKKTIYDLWDNMIKVVALNLGFLACTAIPILPLLFPNIFGSNLLVIVFAILGTLICSIYLATAAFTIKSISDYGTFTFSDFLANLKTAWPAGIAMFVFLFIIYIVVSIVIPFYAAMASLIGLALSALLIWVLIFAFLSFQFYFAVYARLGANIMKSFRKCMLISLDNTGMSIFLFIHNILALMISVIFVFMFPGPIGVLLYLDEALRLRLLKYDYLEANPEADRKKIPWDALLIDEREKTGNRTLKNFIFPWKD